MNQKLRYSSSVYVMEVCGNGVDSEHGLAYDSLI